MTERFYWYRTCPACGQGRLFITEDITNGRLYLHCEDCEMGWLRPEDSSDPSKGFLTLNENFETTMPSRERIHELGWSAYVKSEMQRDSG
jgi:hypothetical protein